jgi:hypothetical protein
MAGPLVRDARSQSAADGRAASQRIDRVEQQTRTVLETVVAALGADGLRAKLGEDRALEMLEAAGYQHTDAIRAKWQQDARERSRSVSQTTVRSYNGGYEGDPAHDQRITDAIMAGASGGELRQIMAVVAREYGEQAARKAAEAQRRADVLWIDRSGKPVVANSTHVPLGVGADPYTGRPAQQSIVHRGVAALGSEPVGETPMSDVRPVATTCTEHSGHEGDR